MRQSIGQALWGCLEIPLFMKIGPARFVNSPEAMKASFVVPAFLLPLMIWLASINPEYAAMPFGILVFKFILFAVSTLFVYLLLIYAITGWLDRRDRFNHFVNAYNWLNVSSFVMILPIALLVIFNIYTFEEVEHLILFIMMYGFAYTGFLITFSLNINWMLAASLAIVNLGVVHLGQTLVFQQ